MRRLVLVLLVVAGCDFAAGESLDDGAADDGAGEPAPGAGECATADDCALAASTCCECPTYAVAGGDADVGACDEVECPAPDACPAIVAACEQGVCTIACAPVTCDLTCADGFAVDEAGCLVCACAAADPAPACVGDDDCVRVAGDCCGCARGGADTAVPAGTEDSFGESLMCPADPSCPDVDVCDPSLAPRCVSGRCALVAPPADDRADARCGAPELPPCPEGTVCVLNADSEATEAGLGVCRPG